MTRGNAVHTILTPEAQREVAERVVRLERERAIAGSANMAGWLRAERELRGMWFVLDRLSLGTRQHAHLQRVIRRERVEAAKDDGH